MSGTNSGNNPDMCDLALTFGADLDIDATGDLAVSSGTQLGQDRVLRRLLTNPGNYIWNLTYGAGLARYLGHPAAATRIAAVAKSQMRLESIVSQKPGPSVSAAVEKDGVVTLSISYVDADTGATQLLALPVGD